MIPTQNQESGSPVALGTQFLWVGQSYCVTCVVVVPSQCPVNTLMDFNEVYKELLQGVFYKYEKYHPQTDPRPKPHWLVGATFSLSLLHSIVVMWVALGKCITNNNNAHKYG